MTKQPEDDLRRLLHEAVDGVQPADRIAQIREQTQVVTPGPWRRRTAIGGAVLATAAAVSAIAVVPSLLDEGSPGPAANPTIGQDVSPSAPGASVTVDPPLPEPGDTQSVPAYFVGEGPRGPRLYREFVVNEGSEARLLAALRALENSPGDPDYRSPWPQGAIVGADYSPDTRLITVDLADVSLAQRPEAWDAREAELAVQQAVYTAQGAVGEGRIPIRFRVDGEPVDSLFGVPTDQPITNAPIFDTLSLMNISYPFEGAAVQNSFTATGVNNSFESTVIWRIEDGTGTVVLNGFTTAEGWADERLYPWETEVDVSGLPPGDYTFVAENDDPTGGAEGNGPDSDTRLIVIE
ncbi:hypothetical protein GCM10027020_20550 [Nocardioides salsibiostraticola]